MGRRPQQLRGAPSGPTLPRLVERSNASRAGQVEMSPRSSPSAANVTTDLITRAGSPSTFTSGSIGALGAAAALARPAALRLRRRRKAVILSSMAFAPSCARH
jgi:hypothetical protein